MQLASKLNQSVTYAAHSSISATGAITYGSQSTISARVELDRRFVAGADGNPVEVNHVIYSETEIPLGARVWLPGSTAANNQHSLRVMQSISTPSLRATQTLWEARC